MRNHVMTSFNCRSLKAAFLGGCLSGALTATGWADLPPQWTARVDAGSSYYAGITAMATDPSGVTFITGITGASDNTDITTAAFATDGTLLWSHVFNGVNNWHDQSRGMTLGADGFLYVCGNTPDPQSYANVLVLKYNPATGALLRTIHYSSGAGISEYAASIVADAQGNVYVTGGTVGDGGDVLTIKFDSAGNELWSDAWDGEAWGPYSQDGGVEVALAADGNPVVLIHGISAHSHPDFVVVKYASSTGARMWQGTWGVNGADSPRDMEIDGAGNIFVVGTGIDFRNKFATVKFRGSDGTVLWQQYDSGGFDNSGRAIALDGSGGVYVTGSTDLDADQNGYYGDSDDDFYTVKRDATTGAFVWSHHFGGTNQYELDGAGDIAVDEAGHIFVIGQSNTPPYTYDMLLFALDAATGAELERGVVGGISGEYVSGAFVDLDAAGNISASGDVYDGNAARMDMIATRFGAPGSVTLDATLVGYSVALGSRLSGGLLSLRTSDDKYLRGQSQPGFGGNDNHIYELRITATTDHPDPQRLDLTFEGRLNEPGGVLRLRLKNWSTGAWQQVHQSSLGRTERVIESLDVSAANRVRMTDGRIDVSIRQTLLASFSTDGFVSLTDFVKVTVE
jgi:hypothetical protein